MSLKLKIVLFLSLLFAIAVFNATLVYLLDSENDKKISNIHHQKEIILTAQQLLKSLVDAETGQRGYLLTLNTHYLEPYHTGLRTSYNHLKKLKQLVGKQAEQIKQLRLLNDIQGLMEEKFAELAKTISLMESGKKQDSLALVQSDKGKQIMDGIREKIQDFLHTQKIQTLKYQQQYEATQQQIKNIMLFTIISFFFISILTYLFLNRTLFQPFHTLVITTKKTERGVKADISDVVPNDEMGYLISRLFKMNEIVIERTEALAYNAQHDNLTGLKNRRAFEKEVPEALKNAATHSSLLAFCFLDLNKFKPINDQFGHNVGDAVLKATAQKLRHVVRSEDIYRMGGDEFLVLLKTIHHSADVEKFAQRVIKAFNEAVKIEDKEIIIGVSLGIAIYPKDGEDIDTLIEHADTAMYQAKQEKQSSSYRLYSRGDQG